MLFKKLYEKDRFELFKKICNENSLFEYSFEFLSRIIMKVFESISARYNITTFSTNTTNTLSHSF